MTITPNAKRSIFIVVVAMCFWTIGYVQGNAAGSRRIAIANFIMHSSTLKRFQDGDFDAARLYATMSVRAGDNYLHSDPFWWAALKEVFTVDNEELFEKQVPFARERVEWSSNAPKIHVVDTQSRNQNEER